MTEYNFICRVCGQTHEEIPWSFAADFPDMYANLSPGERATRAVISSDQCIVDEQWYYLRGCLEIPIIGSNDVFLWGLWASVKEETFNAMSESWEEEGRETRRGPFKGRLANSLSIYSETLNVKLRILVQPVGTRPLFVLEEDEHPLARTQRHGMSRRAAAELTAQLLHVQGPWSRSIQ